MKKIILFALYCAPLLSLDRPFNRDRFYVDGYRRAAFEGGLVVGLIVSEGLMNTIDGVTFTFADAGAVTGMGIALGDIGYNYPSADNAVVLGRDAFKELGEVDNTKEYFAGGFAATFKVV